MDKTAFQALTFEQADNQKVYWQSCSLEERLRAATELIQVAYKIADIGFSPMEKNRVTYKKRDG